MRASTLCIALLLVAVPIVALAPTANAGGGLPPEEIGGECFALHWHGHVDPAQGDYPHYHAHWYCF